MPADYIFDPNEADPRGDYAIEDEFAEVREKFLIADVFRWIFNRP